MTTATQVLATDLYRALRSRSVIDPPTKAHADMTVETAYEVSRRFLELRLADGEELVGRKIGLTSKVVQEQLGVGEPDFGNLTDAMMYDDGAEIPISKQLIQPKAEGEIAFVLRHDLVGDDISEADVLAATDYVSPCFEIVDSRVRDWKISLADTICDNASCGLFVLGNDRADPRNLDLSACEMVVRTNGEVVATGTGAAALGSPLTCVTWLANTMNRYGAKLKAGEILLSGSLVPFLPATPGDQMTVSITGIGEAGMRFV